MPQWNQVSPQFSRGITTAMSNAMQGFDAPGRFAEGMLNKMAAEEEKAYARGRQKVLDDRAATAWSQQQAERQAQIDAGKLLTRDVAGAHAVRGQLADEFQQADAAAAAIRDKEMQAKISSNPKLLEQYTNALKGEDFMQMNTQGQMVAMSPEDRARMERMTKEQVLGINPDYRGEEAVRMALASQATQQEAKRNQLEALSPVARNVSVPQQAVNMGSRTVYGAAPLLGRKEVSPAIPSRGEVQGSTSAEWVNQHPEVLNKLFKREGSKIASTADVLDTPGMYTTVPGSSVRKPNEKGQLLIDTMNKYSAQEEPLKAQIRELSRFARRPEFPKGKEFNLAVNRLQEVQFQKDKALAQASQDDGVVSREDWAKASEKKGVRTGIVTDAIMKIPDPKVRNTLLEDFGTAIQGQEAVKGKEAKYKDIYGDRPILYRGEKISVSNSYKGKVVTDIGGRPMDLTGIPETSRGVIVDAQKSLRKDIEKMFGVEDVLASSARSMLTELAGKRGVPLQSLQPDVLLKQSGLSGEATPAQQRAIDLAKGDMAAAVEQYKMDYQVDKDKADRAFNERKLAIDTSLKQAAMAQDASQFKMNYGLKLKEMASKGNDTKITMFKKTADGVQTVEVPAGMVNSAVQEGFNLGKFGYAPQRGTKNVNDGKSEISLLELGGKSWVGGTSGADLEALASRMKSRYKNVPMSAIKAEIASQVQGNYATDAVDLGVLESSLKGYKQ